MPSRYCVTVKPETSVCRVCATSCGVSPRAPRAILVDIEPDRLHLLVPIEVRIDELAVFRHHLADVFRDGAHFQRVGADHAELNRKADRRAEDETVDTRPRLRQRAVGDRLFQPRLEALPPVEVFATITICAKLVLGSSGLRPSQNRGAPAPT